MGFAGAQGQSTEGGPIIQAKYAFRPSCPFLIQLVKSIKSIRK